MEDGSVSAAAFTARFSLATVLVLVLVACTGTAGDSDDGVSTVSSGVDTAESAAGTATTTPALSTTEPATPASTGAPSATTDPESEPLVLVAGDGGAVFDGAGGDPFVSGPVAGAADDRMGGIVFQRAAGRWQNDPEDTIIWWLAGSRGEPRALLVPTGDQWLSLVDVDIVAGAVTIVYVRSEGTVGPEDFRDTLRTYDVVTGDVKEVATVGGWESGPGQISFGDGLFAVNWFAEAVSGFDFYGPDGSEETVAGNPYSDGDACFDGVRANGRPCFTNVAISDDGLRLGYLEDTMDAAGLWSGTSLVVVDRDGTSELVRIDLQRADQAWFPTGLDLSGSFVLVNRADSESGSPLSALLIESSTGSIRELAIAGFARFTSTIPAP